MSPHPEDKDVTPFLDLDVHLHMPPNVSDPPVVFVHCGGPGSGAECANIKATGPRFSRYAILAISQRGTGPGQPNPSFDCDSPSLPPPNKTSYDISDFTTCPCALPDGTPLVDQAYANLDPMDEDQVQGLFQNMAIRARKCYDWDKWLIMGQDNETIFHFLEWSGTRMLAADIEFLRTRVCVPRLDFHGESYGTAVVATYASMYPERVGKIMLDASMPPVPETLTFAKGQGMAMTQAFGHLERLCLEQPRKYCSSFDSQNDTTLTDQWLNLTNTIRAGQLTATTNMTNSQGDYVQFPLTIGVVEGYLQGKMAAADYSAVFTTIQNLIEGSEKQIAEILNSSCSLSVPPIYEVHTWYTYGVCVGQASVGKNLWEEMSEKKSGFMAEPAILAQDYSGRFAVAQAMQAYREFKSTWNDAMATGAFVAMFSVLSSWTAEAVPVQPGFRTGIKALVLGNLYDPNTPFIWSNHMRESLPDGAMIIWQGGGHGERRNDDNMKDYMKDCTDAIDRFWETGRMPKDGLTCRTPKFK